MLQQGEVLTKTKNHGRTIVKTQMLLLPQTKLSLEFSEDKDYIEMTISDTVLDVPDLSGKITVTVLEDYIKALKQMHLQLVKQQEV